MSVIRAALVAVTITVATATTSAACDPASPAPTSPAVHTNNRDLVEFTTNCDVTNGHAVNVTPDTDAARSAAERACQNSHRDLQRLGWE